MTTRNFDAIFHPQSIAVIGAGRCLMQELISRARAKHVHEIYGYVMEKTHPCGISAPNRMLQMAMLRTTPALFVHRAKSRPEIR